MGKVRSLLCLGALFWASHAAAEARLDLVRLFATCSGAYMAELEHAWLVGDPRADELERRRAQFLSVLDAVVSDDRSNEALAYRVEARAAHRGLLSDASFGTEAAHARWAARRAKDRMALCSSLLLDS